MSREDFVCLRCGRPPLYRKIDGQTYYFCTCGDRKLTNADKCRGRRARQKAKKWMDSLPTEEPSEEPSAEFQELFQTLQKGVEKVSKIEETQDTLLTLIRHLNDALSLYKKEKKDSLSLSLSQEANSVGGAESFPPSAEREREGLCSLPDIPEGAQFHPKEMAKLVDIVMENPGYAASVRKNPKMVHEWYFQVADVPLEYLIQGVRELQKNGWKFQPPGREKFRPLPDELGRAIKQEAVWKYKADQKREKAMEINA